MANGLNNLFSICQRHLSNVLLKFTHRGLQRFFGFTQCVELRSHFINGCLCLF